MSLEAARALLRSLQGGLPDRLPAPPNTILGEAFDRQLLESQGRRDGRDIHMFPAHLRKWFDTLSETDVVKLERLMALKAETVTWIEGKNDRELKQLDGVVEFVSSSRTAAKVLMWVCGAAVSFVVGVAAFAKGGYDMLAIFRGGK
ncbi:hypothetical protein [Methylorubrum extorquens]|uniref:hypothetical protein n=1 Tax=Methylorubrum extorquens TaxID=408 RepID=UPI0022380E9C|nr:hypothetical protein [Methylorubrum extorquens]UYW32532.1 hypothetical protein OKB92_26810 [Methylorubrum extorquens]